MHACVSRCIEDQHFDISLPIDIIGDQLSFMQEELLKLEGVREVYIFGHIADGNIHLIVDKVNTSSSLRESINDIVYGPLKAIGGSVSAEHGIGLHKKAYLHLCRSSAEITLMRAMKQQLDPKGILNKGKIFDVSDG